MKTWKTKENKKTEKYITLTCPSCGNEAECPTYGDPGALPIGSIGVNVLFDRPNHEPPQGWLPDEIQCRLCKTVYGS